MVVRTEQGRLCKVDVMRDEQANRQTGQADSMSHWSNPRLEKVVGEVGIYCHPLVMTGVTSAVALINHSANKERGVMGQESGRGYGNACLLKPLTC